MLIWVFKKIYVLLPYVSKTKHKKILLTFLNVYLNILLQHLTKIKIEYIWSKHYKRWSAMQAT